jgi:hypothetical protein
MAIAGKVTVTIGVTTGCLALSPVPRRGTKLPKGEPTAASSPAPRAAPAVSPATASWAEGSRRPRRTSCRLQLRNQPPPLIGVVADRGEEGLATEMLGRPRHSLSLAPGSRCWPDASRVLCRTYI